jgi:hypothetical protein
VLLALFCSNSEAADYRWRHDAFWTNKANWANGAIPSGDQIAVLSTDCENPTIEVAIPTKNIVEVSGFELGDGVELVMEDESEIEFNDEAENAGNADEKGNAPASGSGFGPGNATGSSEVQWRCKSTREIDMRCGDNWAVDLTSVDYNFADELTPSGSVPCRTDSVMFGTSSHVKVSSLPIFDSVQVGESEFTEQGILGVTPRYENQFSAGFLSDGHGDTFLRGSFNQDIADMDCYDTCANTLEDSQTAEVYNETLANIVAQRVFIEENFAESIDLGVIPPQDAELVEAVRRGLLLSVVTNLPANGVATPLAYEAMTALSGDTSTRNGVVELLRQIPAKILERFEDDSEGLSLASVFQQTQAGGIPEMKFKNCRAVYEGGWTEEEAR